MSEKGFDDKTRCTTKGKVVYFRKKHYFTINGINRIVLKYNNSITIAEARKNDVAIKIRVLKHYADSLYNMVFDLFEKDPELENWEYEQMKRTWREANDLIIFKIAEVIAEQSGIELLQPLLSTVGNLINRGVEYIFTGSTGF